MSYSNFNTFKLFQNVGINSSSDYMLSMRPNNNNVSFHSSNSIDYNNVDIMSIKNIINKAPNEDLNLSSLNGNVINPVITINNNNSDCRIMTNLNVSGNINLTDGGMIRTTGIGSFGSITTTGQGSFGSLSVTSSNQVSNLNASLLQGFAPSISNTGDAIVRRDGLGNFTAGKITANTFSASTGSNYFGGNVMISGTTDASIGTTGHPLTITGYRFTSDAGLGGRTALYYSGGSRAIAINGHVRMSVKQEYGSWIHTGTELWVSSDSRIKMNIVDVPDNLALEQLRNIPCRYYEYIDKISRYGAKTIGFIAQEVKSILPMAVTQETHIIPNIYKVINCNWISVNDTFIMSSTDLPIVNGIKYKFYVSNESDYSDEKIVEITGHSDNTFTFDTQYTNVFCYGIEVDDFHIIDKNKLFTLNFSATQEIDRIQQTHITEIALLKAENQQQQTKIATLETENQQQQTKINELTSIIDKLKTANSFEEFKQTL